MFFGDHWSYYDENNLYKSGVDINSLTDEQYVNYYSTPYVVWSNCGYDFSSLPQQTCTSYLSAQVIDCIGIKTTPWQNYLLSWAEKVPSYSFYVLQNNVSGAELSEYSEMLNILHYNALNDSRNYASNIFEYVE